MTEHATLPAVSAKRIVAFAQQCILSQSIERYINVSTMAPAIMHCAQPEMHLIVIDAAWICSLLETPSRSAPTCVHVVPNTNTALWWQSDNEAEVFTGCPCTHNRTVHLPWPTCRARMIRTDFWCCLPAHLSQQRWQGSDRQGCSCQWPASPSITVNTCHNGTEPICALS